MATSRKQSQVADSATIAPRRGQIRPIWALVFFALFLLTAVAFVGFQPNQHVLITSLADSTDTSGQNPVGPLGATLAKLSLIWLGASSIWIPVFFLWLAYLFLCRRSHTVGPWKMLVMLLVVISFAALSTLGESLLTGMTFSENYWRQGLGGSVGKLFYDNLFFPLVGTFGSGLILGLIYVISLIFVFMDGPTHLFERIHKAWVKWLSDRAEARALAQERKAQEKARLEEEKKAVPMVDAPPPSRKKNSLRDDPLEAIPEVPVFRNEPEVTEPETESAEESVPPPAKRGLKLNIPGLKKSGTDKNESGNLTIVESEKVEKVSVKTPRKNTNYEFPPIKLLAQIPAQESDNPENHQETMEALVRTLDEFKIKVTPAEVHTGPVITRYEVTPAPGVRVEKIANLDKNIALGLRALAVRILAPVPGKGTVGIEVPNRHAQPVCMREIVESRAWAESKAEIPIVLGKDVTGKPIVQDLTKMPHCLIAGSTGSGKTVCINSIIASLLYHAGPEDLRFIMVDPKIVEMQIYNDLPHMLIPVVTEPKKVPGALKWLLAEMERRYNIFAKVGVRNIAGFNAKLLKDKEEEKRAAELDAEMTPEERQAASQFDVPRDDDALEIPTKKLPYIVCIIDELADLMMVAPADIETGIARLAQLARAAGIHLILATQRPSVNVITGVIKANLPTRIAFKVASVVDSRTILDSKGAETLIGKGDMLFVPPGTASLVRAQGAFVSDDEINNIVEYLKRNGPPQFAAEVQQQIDSEGEEDGAGGSGAGGDNQWGDEMVPAALDVLRSTKRASTSMLQRRLRIGYNRAARIMEILEDEGIVGPENGSSPREILKDLDSL